MKKLIITLSISLAFQGFAMAQGSTYKSGEYVRISSADSIQTQLLATGEAVEMFGWLGNDLFSAAEILSIDGAITDDALVAGRRITVRGTIGDLLMGAADSFLIDGEIDGDIFIAGREVRITENARILGNAYIAASSLNIDGGNINGQLTAVANSMNINGIINNKADLYGRNFTFGPNYHAEYGTDITSNREIHRENLGDIPANLNITVSESEIWRVILFKVGLYISLLITGLVLIRIFEKNAVDLFRFSTERLWKNTGIGFLAFLAVPLAAFILFILVVTIPLSLILILLYGLALLTGYLLVAMILGVMSILYFRDEANASTYYWGLALGIIYIAIMVNLPFIGWLFHALLLFFGLGSIVYYIWKMRSPKHAPAVS